MTPEQWTRVERLYHEAGAQPHEQRDEWLTRACEGDELVKREVESLLAQDASSNDLLDGNAISRIGVSASAVADLVGECIGSYEIVELIDEGGMGQVYRAHDLTLPRDVAIKVIPAALSYDPVRRTRFRQEAELLASLSHPHIAHVYAFAEDGVRALLIMELVPGRTLAERIARGPLPVSEALATARQIADALDAAHEHAVMHRDLKPANIKITPEGDVKVLDFGLARPVRRAGGTPAATHAEGPLFGTAAYLSPEQARGESVDRRGDIWAFGCVLFEMLTGRQVFSGATVTEILTAILEREPDWSALPASVPPGVHALLRRCLDKDPRRRLRDIGEARVQLDDLISGSPTHSRPPQRLALAAAAGVALLAMGAAVWYTGWLPGANTAGTRATTRVLVGSAPADSLPARPTRTDVALSPDGRVLVFSGLKGSTQQLYARPMDRLEATPIPGTEGTNSPFFSPDGQWVAFWQGPPRNGAIGELRKVRLDGSPAVTICPSVVLFGASWGANDTIVFANARGGLLQVPAAGGTPQPFTKLDQSKDERSHRLPHFLPDGRSILFTITQSSATTGLSNAQIVVRSLADGQQRVVVTGGVDGRYVESGHIVYARENTLMAVPFDPRRLAVTGPAVAVVEGVLQAHGPFGPGGVSVGETGAAQFSVSPSGALVYTPGGPFSENLRSLVWVDRHGAEEPLAAPLHNYLGPRLSPDGKRLLVGALGFKPTMWLYDMTRGTFAPTGPPTDVFWPIWSPDGRRVTYGSDLVGRGLESVRLDGGPAETIIAGGNNAPGAWSPDGRTLAFTRLLPTSGWEMRVWSADGGDRALHPPSSTPFLERYPTFSPDGGWLAYASDESGRDEVYVQPYPGSGREQISTGGGLAPAWSRDGRELFYMIPSPGNPFLDPVNTRLMVVSVSHDSVLVAGPPRFLFEGHYTQCSPMRCYDPAPDGQHFVMVKFSDSPPPNEPVNTQMVVVLNWFDELRRLAPASARR